MYISLNWIKDFVNLPDSINPKELAEQLTLKTAEIEQVFDESKIFDNMVAGLVLELKLHPNADKLRIATTSIGKKTIDLVCGGENLKEGMYVAIALPGAKVYWHGEGEKMTIEKTKIRGVESTGMICASSELGIDNTEEGPRDIMDLSPLKPTPGTPLSQILQQNDIIFEFDNKSLTHRPDLWGHLGMAREIAAITNKEFKELNPKVQIPKNGEKIEVEIKDFNLCPRYCGLIIKNVTITDSPAWLKKRLKSTGHGTHNNIIDVTNYVMTELGQPMHAFDKAQIKEKIIVRRALKNETIITLEQKEKKLLEEHLVIADKERPMAIAGIIGGEKSGINKNTKDIILEAANFNPASIRRTSVNLGIRTDSVQRFEKSLDPNLTELAIKRAAQLILEICPNAKIAGPITDIKKIKKTPPKISISIKKIHSKIGMEIPATEIKNILKKLHFSIRQKSIDIIEIQIPSFRATKDINMEDDIIEEIARIYGYENIPAKLPSLPTRLPMENKERFKKHKIRELLSLGLGFDEVYNYSFYGLQDIQKCCLPEKLHLQLLNYLSEDQSHLRTSLIPNLLKNCQTNVKNFSEFKIYEIGKTYKEIGKSFPLEEKNIAGILLSKNPKTNLFYKTKGTIETLLKKFNITLPPPIEQVHNTPYAHPVKSMTYLNQKGESLIKIFVLHPQTQKAYDLENYTISAFEINFSKIFNIEYPSKTFTPIGKFPKINIDISVVINKNTTVQTVMDEIQKSDPALIKNIELFDLYEGDNIDKTKKAIAFTITLQSDEKTLSDEEMSTVQQKIFKNLEKMGGEIRGK